MRFDGQQIHDNLLQKAHLAAGSLIFSVDLNCFGDCTAPSRSETLNNLFGANIKNRSVLLPDGVVWPAGSQLPALLLLGRQVSDVVPGPQLEGHLVVDPGEVQVVVRAGDLQLAPGIDAVSVPAGRCDLGWPQATVDTRVRPDCRDHACQGRQSSPEQQGKEISS